MMRIDKIASIWLARKLRFNRIKPRTVIVGVLSVFSSGCVDNCHGVLFYASRVASTSTRALHFDFPRKSNQALDFLFSLETITKIKRRANAIKEKLERKRKCLLFPPKLPPSSHPNPSIPSSQIPQSLF